MARITLINPKFDASYWGLEHALPIVGKRSNLPTACLPLLAALTPREHHVTLVDENVEPIDFDEVQHADIVGLTGMSVQRRRMKEILRELKSREAFCVVGGPWVTVQEDDFGPLADVIFVGEAEETWPRFLREWESGGHQRRYEQSERTDMTRVPVPRYDLLQMRHGLGPRGPTGVIRYPACSSTAPTPCCPVIAFSGESSHFCACRPHWWALPWGSVCSGITISGASHGSTPS